MSSARSTLFSRVIWLSASRISLFIPFSPVAHRGPAPDSRPRIDDQARRAHLAPVEPDFLTILGLQSHPAAVRDAQLALEIPAAVARLDQREARPLTAEPGDRLERPQRTIEPRGAHLEVIAPRNGLIHVETVGQSPAERRAVPDRDPARLVEEHADRTVASLNGELDVHQLVTGLLRQRLGQQSNFFSDFQFALPAGTKNGVVAPAPLLGRTIPELGQMGKPGNPGTRRAAPPALPRRGNPAATWG